MTKVSRPNRSAVHAWVETNQHKLPTTMGDGKKVSNMEQPPFNSSPQKRKREPKEWKVVSLRECPVPEAMQVCESPDNAADYWRLHVMTNPYLNPDCECFVVLMLNTRRRVRGHQLTSIGTLETILVHPREVFRAAIISGSSAIVVMHNHPSGDPSPSEADIKITRDLIRAGQLLKVEVLDHIIIGNPKHCSLRELGYFF